MKLLLLSSLMVAVVSSESSSLTSNDLDHWQRFKVEHSKSYVSIEEEEERRRIFLDNLSFIRDHNKKHGEGKVSYKTGINKFSDLRKEETASRLHGCFISSMYVDNGYYYDYLYEGDLPESVDWRTEGVVTAVKDQGHCGSCWAFSATGSLESMHAIKTGKLVSLSEQNLVDCVVDSNGCHGGNVQKAIDYVSQNHGIDTEAAYPYTEKDGTCRYKSKNNGATAKGYVNIYSGDEDQLMMAVALNGPVSVAIDANHKNFFHYESGVFSEETCSNSMEHLGHAVLVVGYGTTDKGEDYWLIKNSWGTSWGMNGYMMLARNRDNMCGVATEAVYPIV